jgi:hypothetical protein
MSKQYYNLAEIPEPEKDPQLWDLINHPRFKDLPNVLILNEIRKYDPATLTSEACRTQLAKLKAFSEVMDLPSFLQKRGIEQSESTDEIPE